MSVRVVRSLCLQTWNCFGTAMDPKAVLRRRGPPDAHRLAHPHVVEALQTADVLCMQEVWIPEAVELFDRLDFPHKIRDEMAWHWWPLTIAGSGLGVASRLPVVHHEIRPFRTRGAGVDGLARKGMLMARLAWEGIEIDLVTVHLQAAGAGAAERVRAAQLREIRGAIDELGAPDRPLVVCGDLNIDGLAGRRTGEYARVRAELSELEDLGGRADEPTMCPRAELNSLAHRYWSHEPVQRLDYVLLRRPRSVALEVRRVERLLDAPLPRLDARPSTFASDHFGLRVRLEA